MTGELEVEWNEGESMNTSYRLRLFCCLFLFLPLTFVFGFSYSVPYGVVTEGSGSLTIVRRGEVISLDLNKDGSLGVVVFPGDMIQTGNLSFIQLQFFPAETLVVIPENTNLQLKHLNFDEPLEIELLYGRVRVKNSSLSIFPAVHIHGQNSMAELEHGDFGVDFTIPRTGGTEPEVRVYTFAGNSQIHFFQFEEVTRLSIPSGNIVVYRDSATFTELPQVDFISSEVRGFWQQINTSFTPVSLTDINHRHPLLKVALLQKLREARHEDLRWSIRQRQRTLSEVQELIRKDVLPPPTYADKIPGIVTVQARDLLPPNPSVYTVNTGRVLGSAFTGASAFSGLAAAAVLVWGEQVFGLSSGQIPGVSLTFFVGAVGGFALGLPLYFLNLP